MNHGKKYAANVTRTHHILLTRTQFLLCQAAGVQKEDVYLEIPTQTFKFFNCLYCYVIYSARTA